MFQFVIGPAYPFSHEYAYDIDPTIGSGVIACMYGGRGG